MKFRFSLKDKEADMEADVEGLVEKYIDYQSQKPHAEKKTRYQTRQEEKRKNRELQHKHDMQAAFISLGVLAVLFIILFIMAALE